MVEYKADALELSKQQEAFERRLDLCEIYCRIETKVKEDDRKA